MGQRPPDPPPLSQSAFVAIVSRHQQNLHAFLYRFTGQVEQAHDLVQETFLDAWRVTLAQGAPFTQDDDDAIRRWLFHTAYCKAVSLLRRRRLIRWVPLTPVIAFDFNSESQESISFEERIAETELLRKALNQLSEQDVACLLLRIVQGFSFAEIGLIVDASPETVMKRLSRAKQRLRAAYLKHLQPIQE